MLHFFKSKRDKEDKRIFNEAEYGNWPNVFAFLDRGYPVNFPDPDSGYTLLEFADWERNIAVISVLKEDYGALDRTELEVQAITRKFHMSTMQNAMPSPSLVKPIAKRAEPKPHVRFSLDPEIAQVGEGLNRITLNSESAIAHPADKPFRSLRSNRA